MIKDKFARLYESQNKNLIYLPGARPAALVKWMGKHESAQNF